MNILKVRTLAGERGQAAVFITILLMFAFIALAALAIDGGHLYVVRRDLQNMADAACLAAATELALGGDEPGAYQAAVDYVLANGGTPELFSDPPEGEGAGLVSGIVVTGKDIRVALRTVVDTYFTMIFNRPGAGVGAGAHCNAQAGGKLLPIAVRRYEYVEGHPEQQLDIVANKNCQPPACYYGNDYKEVPWAGYYGETLFRPISDTFHIPISGTLEMTETGNIDCDLPPQDGVLDGACVLGVHPETNDGTEKFSGFVSLDIRNITGGCPPNRPAYECGIQYYNGASGQDATNKLLASEWFCGGTWEGWRVPELGDQLAFLPGVSARFSPKTMSDCGWDVGSQFVAVVYSGYVWDVPDFEIRIEPLVNEVDWTGDGDIHTVSYTVYLEKPSQSKPWEGGANFELDPFLMVEDAPVPITPTIGLQPSVWFPWETDVIEVPMTITVTDSVSTTEYLTAVTVQAREATFTNLKRWASTNFMYGDVTGDFTLAADSLEIVAEPGDHLNIPVTTRGFGFSAKNPNPAPITGELCGGPSFSWNEVFSSEPDSEVEIKDGISSSEVFRADIRDDLPSWMYGPYDVCLTVTGGDEGSHTVRLTVVVVEPTEGGTPTRFVIVEGFAPFEISYIDENDVVAFAIGPIVPTLENVTAGTRAALLPW